MKRPTTLIIAAFALATGATAQMQGFPQQGQGFPGQGQGMPQQGGQGFGQPVGQQQGGMNYQSLSGNWIYSTQKGPDQMPWQFQVSPTGQFQGRQGQAMIQGQFRGMVGQGKAVAPRQNGQGNMVHDVRFQFDGGCHINVTLIDKGKPFAQGMMHVNHQAGAPCPAQGGMR